MSILHRSLPVAIVVACAALAACTSTQPLPYAGIASSSRMKASADDGGGHIPYSSLEANTDIPAATWRTWWNRGGVPGGQLVEAAAKTWPHACAISLAATAWTMSWMSTSAATLPQRCAACAPTAASPSMPRMAIARRVFPSGT